MRSSPYPSYTIEECISIVDKIYDFYGDATYVDRSQIAEALDYSEGAIVTRVSACTQYGLLDKQTKIGYKPSELYQKISKPISEIEKKEALIDAFSNPSLYKKIIDRFAGHHFPNQAAFGNILFRDFSISSKVANHAVKVFFKNAYDLNLIDSNNHLNLNQDSLIEEETGENTESNPEDLVNTKKDSVQQGYIQKPDESSIGVNNYHKLEIPLTEKKKAIISIPIDLNNRDILIIKKQMEVFELYIETEETI